MPGARLDRYRSRRDFSRTPEPSGGHRGAGEGFFVVQKHAARRLHYDFRLAHDGVLLSWAVTRGPSLDPADTRLAVRTEDHPLDYADFEGAIPRGQYGGGTVMLWDRGRYRPRGDLARGLKDGKIEVELEGERLRGGFALVRMRGRGRRETWLLIKERDAAADPGWDPDAFDRSVASGRGMPEIAGDAPDEGGRAPPPGGKRPGKARKVKRVRRQEFVIGGWSPSSRDRAFASLLLGVWEDGGLRYAGRVGTGFDAETLEALGAALGARARKKSPFATVPRAIARGARWCRPELVAEVAYTELTAEGYVRHGVFRGLREDKPARSIDMEKAADEAPDDRLAGVTLTHPDRVLFPAMGTTKRDLASYLVAVAPRLLPHLRGRPVSLVRCPQGRAKVCFFQKHAGKGFPEAFGTVPIREKDGGTEDYLLVEGESALAACAQVGVLELHVWGSRRDAIEKPDRIVFDLDPGDGVPFAEVRRAAKELAAILKDGGLAAFPLVTGGKGVHLVLPVVRRHPWPAVSAFAKGFAEKVAALDPERFVATMSKAKRSGRIFVDHFRNQRGATAIAPYSPRAKEGGPVAMPVSWEGLESLPAANGFSFAEALRRAQEPDPWRDYAGLRQSLGAAKLRRIGLAGLL